MRYAEKCVGHVPGRLLMAWRYQLDLFLVVVQHVKNADIAVTADPENIGHLLANQMFDNQFSALCFAHINSSQYC